MKVLMISIDKGLLGKGQLGDVIERHREYGKSVERLDIIVFSKTGFCEYEISDLVKAYPTNSSCRLKYFFDALRIGRKLFGENQYDLIVTQEPFLTGLVGVRLKKSFGSKLLVHFHGDFVGLKLIFAKLFVLPKVDAIRVMSLGQKTKLVSAGLASEKIEVISTPVNLKKFEDCIIDSSVKSDKKVILHIGRSDIIKDYDTLVKALAKINNNIRGLEFWQFGGREEFIKALNRQKENQISGLENLDYKAEPIIAHQDLLKNYAQADVLVLSSKSESFGKVLIEANICGKPVVSTATTGAKEIIQEGINGYLVPIGDAEALAKKIIYLLQNPEVAQEMGERGKKIVLERFSDNTQKIIQYWNFLVNEK